MSVYGQFCLMLQGRRHFVYCPDRLADHMAKIPPSSRNRIFGHLGRIECPNDRIEELVLMLTGSVAQCHRDESLWFESEYSNEVRFDDTDAGEFQKLCHEGGIRTYEPIETPKIHHHENTRYRKENDRIANKDGFINQSQSAFLFVTKGDAASDACSDRVHAARGRTDQLLSV